ncbi:hypothetical protein QOZ80_3AG0220900 [Eleusine coracana subsp. coracana]|nr:hypothetical protein QOZ80_3AG0220900 [Eleusine coracana subsp. coracana]
MALHYYISAGTCLVALMIANPSRRQPHHPTVPLNSPPRLMARAISDTAGDARMKLTCSHGGRLVHCGPDAAPHYVGGVTRVLAVPRSAHRLADDEEIIVSVTCDEELAHMVHEYDRLHAKRPHAAFRVFFFAAAHQLRRRSGLPPLPPTRMRRVQSDQALPLRARPHRWPAAYPAPVRRVQSAQEIAGSSYRLQPSFDQYQNCRGVRYAPVAPAAARPMHTVPYMSN